MEKTQHSYTAIDFLDSFVVHGGRIGVTQGRATRTLPTMTLPTMTL